LITAAYLKPGAVMRVLIFTSDFTFEMNASVAWCRELPSTKKIIKKKPDLIWRTGLQFKPKSEEEKQLAQILSTTL
jgi:hypothetical protein